MTNVIACALVFGFKHVDLVQDHAYDHGDCNDDGEEATTYQDSSFRFFSHILPGLINALIALYAVIH